MSRTGHTLRYHLGAVVAAFVLAFSAGAVHAVWVDTGDDWYYYDAPFGTIYCAGINSAIYTNSNVPSSNYIQQITDAKSHRDLFCVNPSNAPAGYNYAQSNLVSATGNTLCLATNWVANQNNNSVARAWYYYNTTSGSTPSNCRPGRYFRNDGAAIVALNFANWPGWNSTGWAWHD